MRKSGFTMSSEYLSEALHRIIAAAERTIAGPDRQQFPLAIANSFAHLESGTWGSRPKQMREGTGRFHESRPRHSQNGERESKHV